MSPTNIGQSATVDEKARGKDNRWALHRRKSHMQRGFQASKFETDNQITFSVLTQHSTVEWHTVPWLHTALIFCRTEWHTCRYWSHSSNTIVKGKDVPVYTMKTYTQEVQLQLHWSATSADNIDEWSASCISCCIAGEGSHNIHWTRGQMGYKAAVMFWIEKMCLVFAKKQDTYGPALKLSLYWLSWHWK